jgi:DNA polymerase-3 subunit delta'
VFIIDGAEHLSSEAANCLLKTLEEPPPQVLLILLATKERLLLPTVVSRCQRLELHPLSRKAVAGLLAEKRGTDAQKAKLVASLSGGCLGWALAAEENDALLAQRCQKLAELLQVAAAGYEERFAYAAQLATQFSRNRESAVEVLKLWLCWWHDLLLVKTGCGAWITNVDQEAELGHQATGYKLAQIKGAIDSLQASVEKLERNANPRLALEVLMLNLPLKRG